MRRISPLSPSGLMASMEAEEVVVPPAEDTPAADTPEGEAAPAADVPSEDPPAEAPAEEPAPEAAPAEDTPAEAPVEGEAASADAEAPAAEAPATPAEGETPAEPEAEEKDFDTASLDADLEAVQDSTEEGEDAEAAKDEAEEVIVALESLQGVLVAAMEHNGLDTFGASILHQATDTLLKRVGFSADRRETVSLESFDPATTTILTRRESTKIALESIQDKIKEIFKAIVAAMKRAIEWVKTHVKKILDAAILLERAANQMVARAEKTKKEVSSSEGMISSALAAKLTLGGKFASDMPAAISELAKATEMVLVDMQDKSLAIGEKIVYGVEHNHVEYTDEIKLLAAKIDSFTEVSKSQGFEAPEGTKIARSHELLGGKALIQQYLSVDAKDATMSMVKTTLGDFDPHSKNVVEDMKVSLLTPNEVSAMATKVAEMAKIIGKYRDRLDRVVAVEERCATAAHKLTSDEFVDKIMKSLFGEDNVTEENKFRNNMRDVAVSLPRLLSEPYAAFSAYALHTGRALLEFGNVSLKDA